ncbi:Filament-like plant protein 7 [Bienertia sinuspersici]
MDEALKECMLQLRYDREDKEQRIHDVMLKASEELEQTMMSFDEKLEQTNEVEDEVNALLERLEHLQKDNNSLLYEVRVLEKEVDIRNKEMKFHRRSTNASHKHHMENVKKITKLESECQKLPVFVRKRLPGPTVLAKMMSEMGILNLLEEKMNLLNEKSCALKEENNTLLETLQQKMNELQISRNMYLQAALKLSRFEAQIEESHKVHSNRDARKGSLISNDLSLASTSDVASDDKASRNGSWASKSIRMTDINPYMGDFAEIKKLALVCVDKPIKNSSDPNTETEFEVFTQEITLVLEWIMGHCFSLQDDSSMKDAIKKQLDWDETRSGREIQVIIFELSKLSLQKDGYHIDSHRNNVSEEVRKVRNIGRDLGIEFECIFLRNQLQKSKDTIIS